MIEVLNQRRREVSDVIAGRISQCADSYASDIDSEEEGGK